MHGRSTRSIAVALAGLTFAVAAPAAAANAAPQVTYAGGATLSCVLLPNAANVVGPIPAVVSATGPAYAVSDESISLTNGSVLLPLPYDWTASFGSFGANVVAGAVTELILDGTGVDRSTVNPAAQQRYSGLDVLEMNELRPDFGSAGAGLPFGPAIISTYPDVPYYRPVDLQAPVTTQTETDTVGTPTWNPPVAPPVTWDAPTGSPSSFVVGPVTVTGSSGQSVGFSFDTTTGAQRLIIGAFNFADTANPSVDQYGNPPTGSQLVFGFAPTTCTAAAGATIASIPIVAPPAVTTQPRSVSTQPGAPVTLMASASGTPAPTVQWQSAPKGSTTFTDVAGATAGTLTVADPTDGTRYRAVFAVTVSNPAAQPSGPFTVGTATSGAATVRVARAQPQPRWWWLWRWLLRMFR